MNINTRLHWRSYGLGTHLVSLSCPYCKRGQPFHGAAITGLVTGLLLAFVIGCEAGSSATPGAGSSSASKLKALQAVVAKLQKFPDRFAPDSERTKFNDDLSVLVTMFEETPFSAKDDPATAKRIVELFEQKIERRYSGQNYILIQGHVQSIYADLLDR